jgi:hypothetical protein
MKYDSNNLDLENCSVRMGTIKDANKIIELINLVQPETPWSHEYLIWQYFNSQGNANLYLIINDEKIVSLYAAVKKKIQVSGKIKEALMIQDVITHPDFRGRGFLNYLGRLCVNDIVNGKFFAYVFPNKLSENSFRRNKWTELTKIPLRTMEITSNDKNFKPLDRLVDTIEEFDDISTRIWHDSGLAIGVHRDYSFLNWRYSRPAAKYFKFYLKKDKGFFILKIFEKDNQKKIHILDLVVCRIEKNLITSALQFIKEFAVINSANIITCWLSKEHPYSEMFDKFGLILNTNTERFAFVINPENKNEFSDINKWHLTQGDSDVY